MYLRSIDLWEAREAASAGIDGNQELEEEYITKIGHREKVASRCRVYSVVVKNKTTSRRCSSERGSLSTLFANKARRRSR